MVRRPRVGRGALGLAPEGVMRRKDRDRPVLVHVTTSDMSLDWLLGPQLRAFDDAGYEVVGMSAPGDHVAALEASGIRHVAIHGFTRSSSVGSDLRALVQLIRALRRERPDVVHPRSRPRSTRVCCSSVDTTTCRRCTRRSRSSTPPVGAKASHALRWRRRRWAWRRWRPPIPWGRSSHPALRPGQPGPHLANATT